MEKNYDFRNRRGCVHPEKIRDYSRLPAEDEIEISPEWGIVCEPGASEEIRRIARDLQDYFRVSMELFLPLRESSENPGGKKIFLQIEESLGNDFELCPSGKDTLFLRGGTLLALGRSMVWLEDILTAGKAPFLHNRTFRFHTDLISREVHSGWGIDLFPDEEFNAVLHGGYDTVVLFVKGPDRTAAGECDINHLIRRAAFFGLKVKLYNYIPSFKHPDDSDAEVFFDSVYGDFFRKTKNAAAFGLCGESLEFPSKDPAVTGKKFSESVTDGIRDEKPSPGWYPCSDYPAYLSRIERAVHRVDPEVELSFCTYNWGYLPLEKRAVFLRNFPAGYVLRVPFEVFKEKKKNGLCWNIMDYSISQPEPGDFFLTEAAEARKKNIDICITSNTAGATWDFGTVPYVPAPYCWIRRFNAIRKAMKDFQIRRLYETHHYGWENSIVSDLGKYAFFDSPEWNEPETLLEKLTIRRFGKNAAPSVMNAWKYWSDAMEYYVASNEDQYGPWRVGPAYPFIFHGDITRTMISKELRFPTDPGAHFGWHIINTFYHPFENSNQSPGFLRFPEEIRSLEAMLFLWEKGMAAVQVASDTPEGKRLIALGHFIRNSIRTTINIKRWWILNMKLMTSGSAAKALDILDQMESLAGEEMKNAEDTIPAVETDSRLGWEPSMEYVCDRWHLEWKQRQMKSMLGELDSYRELLKL